MYSAANRTVLSLYLSNGLNFALSSKFVASSKIATSSKIAASSKFPSGSRLLLAAKFLPIVKVLPPLNVWHFHDFTLFFSSIIVSASGKNAFSDNSNQSITPIT